MRGAEDTGRDAERGGGEKDFSSGPGNSPAGRWKGEVGTGEKKSLRDLSECFSPAQQDFAVGEGYAP